MTLVKQTRHSRRDKKPLFCPESESFEHFGLVIAHVVRDLGSQAVAQSKSSASRKNEVGLALKASPCNFRQLPSPIERRVSLFACKTATSLMRSPRAADKLSKIHQKLSTSTTN